jgi:GNAT superfamily N-acetyltransferase
MTHLPATPVNLASDIAETAPADRRGRHPHEDGRKPVFPRPLEARGMTLSDPAGAAGHAARLRDGTPVEIRPTDVGDEDLIESAYERLSATTRYRRFLSRSPTLTKHDLDYFTQIDHQRHQALVGIDPKSGRLMGVVRYVRLPGTADAELSALVVDDWQRRGLAELLLGELTAEARTRGVERWLAIVDESNRPVIEMLERAGAVRSRIDDQLAFVLPLSATP